MKWNKTDLAMSSEGDLSVGIGGDLLLCTGLEEFQQMLSFRSKTIQGDLLMHPGLGNVLQHFIGRRNTRETAEELKTELLNLLAYDGFVSAADTEILVIPISPDAVMVQFTVDNDIGEDYTQRFLFNFERGMESI